jgi:LmbE family N-acetylglucosaminyl deacetylase
MKILAIGAHPDDIEWCVFGTLCKMKQGGNYIACYIATQGGENDPTSGYNRIIESKEALSLIPIDRFEERKRVGLNYSDYPNIVADLEDVAKDFDIVLVPSNKDSHQDHRLIHDIAMSAIRRRRISVLHYNINIALPLGLN